MTGRILALLLIASLCANVALAALIIAGPDAGAAADLRVRVNALERENTALQTQIDQYNRSLGAYATQLDRYRATVHALEQQASCAAPGVTGSAALEAPAVLQRIEDGEDGPFLTQQVTEEGAMIRIAAEIVPGRGRVLVETTPLMGVIFQDAANTAVFVAENRTGVSLAQSDVIFSIEAEDAVPAVDGPSAGALMTLLVIAALTGDDLREEVTLSGTIDPDGSVGGIGGVVEKGEAARDAGKTLLILPRENEKSVVVVQEMRSIDGVAIIEQRPEVIETEPYLEEEVGIGVAFVDDIDDVLALAVNEPG